MKYKTKQTDILLDVIKNSGPNGITANEAVAELEKLNNHISRATIYRKLKVFENEGIVRVVTHKGKKLYELVWDDCSDHLHLVCTNCKKVIHIDCTSSDRFIKYVEDELRFDIDFRKTVIYGLCNDCKK